MKNKKWLKLLLFVFFIILYVTFFVIEQFHECDGDGCLICLLSLIIDFVAKTLLVISFVPFIIEKTSILFRIACPCFKVAEFDEQKNSTNYLNNFSNVEVNLLAYGVSLK